VKRPVRTRKPGVVGAGGEKPPTTRLGVAIVLLKRSNFCSVWVCGSEDRKSKYKAGNSCQDNKEIIFCLFPVFGKQYWIANNPN